MCTRLSRTWVSYLVNKVVILWVHKNVEFLIGERLMAPVKEPQSLIQDLHLIQLTITPFLLLVKTVNEMHPPVYRKLPNTFVTFIFV
jgi:hypothetical protein